MLMSIDVKHLILEKFEKFKTHVLPHHVSFPLSVTKDLRKVQIRITILLDACLSSHRECKNISSF